MSWGTPENSAIQKLSIIIIIIVSMRVELMEFTLSMHVQLVQFTFNMRV